MNVPPAHPVAGRQSSPQHRRPMTCSSSRWVSATRARTWYGIAAYAAYDFLKDFRAALRQEWFDDVDGVRTAVAGGVTLFDDGDAAVQHLEGPVRPRRVPSRQCQRGRLRLPAGHRRSEDVAGHFLGGPLLQVLLRNSPTWPSSAARSRPIPPDRATSSPSPGSATASRPNNVRSRPAVSSEDALAVLAGAYPDRVVDLGDEDHAAALVPDLARPGDHGNDLGQRGRPSHRNL